MIPRMSRAAVQQALATRVRLSSGLPAKAARRLCKLAAHAKLRHEKVLKALVDLAPREKWAVKALNKLLRKEFKGPEDCKRWWDGRG